jgi:hypothetical protein
MDKVIADSQPRTRTLLIVTPTELKQIAARLEMFAKDNPGQSIEIDLTRTIAIVYSPDKAEQTAEAMRPMIALREGSSTPRVSALN